MRRNVLHRWDNTNTPMYISLLIGPKGEYLFLYKVQTKVVKDDGY